MPAAATIEVTVRPHWVNGWFLRLTSRPVIRVDGERHVTRWGRRKSMDVAAGEHRVEASFRYRHTAGELGTASNTVLVTPGERCHLIARAGWTNGSGLRFEPSRQP